MDNLEEKYAYNSPQKLLVLLGANNSVLPVAICDLIVEYVIEILQRFDQHKLQRILKSVNGFKINIQFKLPSVRTLPSTGSRARGLFKVTNRGDPYLKISLKAHSKNDIRLLIFMRGLQYKKGKDLLYPGSLNIVRHAGKSMHFNINTESMMKYENQNVSISLIFEWNADKGYKIFITSAQLIFEHRINRDRIANVKHLSLRSLHSIYLYRRDVDAFSILPLCVNCVPFCDNDIEKKTRNVNFAPKIGHFQIP